MAKSKLNAEWIKDQCYELSNLHTYITGLTCASVSYSKKALH